MDYFRFLLMDEWIKMYYKYIVEFYLFIKSSKILSFVVKWIELEDINLSGVYRVYIENSIG